MCTSETETQPALLAVDPVSWAITPLTVRNGAGATGICRLGDDVFVANQTAEPSVAVLDARTLRARGEAHLGGARDVHSLAPWDGGIAVASTGTDEVLWYRYDGGEFVDRTVLWAAGPSQTDTMHVNGVASHGDRLVCCGFGPGFAEIDIWSQRQNGFLYDITAGRYVLQSLARPHTVAFLGDELFLCESGIRTFRSAGRWIATLDGFTRGVAFLDHGRAVVATSRARVRSRSTGRLNLRDEREPPNTCALHVVDLDGAVHATVPLEEHGREIYDLSRLS